MKNNDNDEFETASELNKKEIGSDAKSVRKLDLDKVWTPEEAKSMLETEAKSFPVESAKAQVNFILNQIGVVSMPTKSTSCGNEKDTKLAEEIFGLDLWDALGKCIEQGGLAFKAVVFSNLDLQAYSSYIMGKKRIT